MKDYIDYLENNSNEDLVEWLEERGVYIEIMLHPEIKDLNKDFSNDNIVVYYEWNIYNNGEFLRETPLIKYSKHKLALRSAITFALKNILQDEC